jgi:hypothetical protein
MSYAAEKLCEAVYALATGEGRLRERLASAANPLVRLNEDDFATDRQRKMFQGITEDLAIFEAQRVGEGRIHSTARQLPEHDRVRIAERIFDLFVELHRSDA